MQNPEIGITRGLVRPAANQQLMPTSSPSNTRRGVVLVGRPGQLRDEAVSHFQAVGALTAQADEVDDLTKALGGQGRHRSSGGAAVVIVTEPCLPGLLTAFQYRWRARRLARRYAALARAVRDQGAEQLIVCSTAFLYGDDNGTSLSPLSPVEPRAETVVAAAAEKAARLFSALGGHAVVLRFGWVFGLHDPITTRALSTARKGWQLIQGRPGAWVSSINAASAVNAIDAATAAPPGTYNVSDGRPVTQAALNAALQDEAGTRLHPLYDPGWGQDSTLFGASRHLADGTFSRLTGWHPVGPDLLAHLSGRLRDGRLS